MILKMKNLSNAYNKYHFKPVVYRLTLEEDAWA